VKESDYPEWEHDFDDFDFNVDNNELHVNLFEAKIPKTLTSREQQRNVSLGCMIYDMINWSSSTSSMRQSLHQVVDATKHAHPHVPNIIRNLILSLIQLPSPSLPSKSNSNSVPNDIRSDIHTNNNNSDDGKDSTTIHFDDNNNNENDGITPTSNEQLMSMSFTNFSLSSLGRWIAPLELPFYCMSCYHTHL
jgi:hypothetical protein